MQKKILLVEDNPGDAVLLKEAFITAGIDQNIEVATNGERALGVLSNYADLDADERADVRFFSAYVLGEIGADADEATTTLLSLLSDPDEGVREQSRQALSKIAPRSIP